MRSSYTIVKITSGGNKLKRVIVVNFRKMRKLLRVLMQAPRNQGFRYHRSSYLNIALPIEMYPNNHMLFSWEYTHTGVAVAISSPGFLRAEPGNVTSYCLNQLCFSNTSFSKSTESSLEPTKKNNSNVNIIN